MEFFVNNWKIILPLSGLVGYFIGNINPAILIAKRAGLDIKKSGSGNAGTTNVLRTLGKKAGALVFIIDVLKGYLPTLLALHIYDYGIEKSMSVGIFIIIGHMFPVVYKFKGGKGVATTLGVLLASNWKLALILLGIFIIITIIFRMVSLGAIIGCLAAVPIASWFGIQYVYPMAIIALLVIIKHRENIVRICKGTENKLSFGRKR